MTHSLPPLRVSAIDFLNPAPLMWDFTHPPLAAELATRYHVHFTEPSSCAHELLTGASDLGLIPIAALTEDLVVVSDCAIASLHEVRSILLLIRLRAADSLEAVRSVAADTASRSSVVYAEILFRHFLGTEPQFLPGPADPVAMLATADAALLIGDPALLARERRQEIEAAAGPCLWIDLAEEWHTRTGLPWVAAVWSLRRDALHSGWTDTVLANDLERSRNNGLGNIDALVAEWTPRICLPPATIRRYLTQNIHYTLDGPCLAAVLLFRELAARIGSLPALPPAIFELLTLSP